MDSEILAVFDIIGRIGVDNFVTVALIILVCRQQKNVTSKQHELEELEKKLEDLKKEMERHESFHQSRARAERNSRSGSSESDVGSP